MPARDHVGECLPPAAKHPGVLVAVKDGEVRIRTSGDVPLSEPECRGLICELSARWSEAYGGVHS